MDEDIRQAAIRARDDSFLNDPLARVDLGAHGVFAHSDDWITRQFSHEPDVALDCAARCGLRGGAVMPADGDDGAEQAPHESQSNPIVHHRSLSYLAAFSPAAFSLPRRSS